MAPCEAHKRHREAHAEPGTSVPAKGVRDESVLAVLQSCMLRVASTIIVLLCPFGQCHAARTPRAAFCVPLTSLPVARSPQVLSIARSKLAASVIPRIFACWLRCA